MRLNKITILHYSNSFSLDTSLRDGLLIFFLLVLPLVIVAVVVVIKRDAIRRKFCRKSRRQHRYFTYYKCLFQHLGACSRFIQQAGQMLYLYKEFQPTKKKTSSQLTAVVGCIVASPLLLGSLIQIFQLSVLKHFSPKYSALSQLLLIIVLYGQRGTHMEVTCQGWKGLESDMES